MTGRPGDLCRCFGVVSAAPARPESAPAYSRPLIRFRRPSANQDMKTLAKHLVRTLSALAIAALTLIGIHRH